MAMRLSLPILATVLAITTILVTMRIYAQPWSELQSTVQSHGTSGQNGCKNCRSSTPIARDDAASAQLQQRDLVPSPTPRTQHFPKPRPPNPKFSNGDNPTVPPPIDVARSGSPTTDPGVAPAATTSSSENTGWIERPRMPDPSATPSTNEAKQLLALLKQGKLTGQDEQRILSPLGEELPKHNFGTHPSLQQVFDVVMKALRTPEGEDAENTIPVYGSACTNNDVTLLLNQLASVDTYVGKFVIVMNAASRRAESMLLALRDGFPEQFIVHVHADNIGVAGAWNTVLRATFGTQPRYQPDDGNDPFCVISNADVMAQPGVLARWARSLRESGHSIVNSRLGHFAFFAVTQLGFNELGFFDEVVFPAYAEDVEYHLRAVSRGLGMESKHFVKFGSNDAGDLYLHNDATNVKAKSPTGKSSYNAQVGRWGKGGEYIQAKWGIIPGSVRDYQFSQPYPYPFNNAKVWHAQSWILDPKHRKCILTGVGVPCQFDTSLIAQLERNTLQPATKIRRPARTILSRATDDTVNGGGAWELVAEENAVFEVGAVAAAAAAVVVVVPSVNVTTTAHTPPPVVYKKGSGSVYRIYSGRWLENKVDPSPVLASRRRPRFCELDVFSGADPVVGQVKECQIYNETAQAWVFLAKEEEEIEWPDGFPIAPRLRIGKEHVQTRLLPPGKYRCNLKTFETSDVAPGVPKRCERFVVVSPGTAALSTPSRNVVEPAPSLTSGMPAA